MEVLRGGPWATAPDGDLGQSPIKIGQHVKSVLLVMLLQTVFCIIPAPLNQSINQSVTCITAPLFVVQGGESEPRLLWRSKNLYIIIIMHVVCVLAEQLWQFLAGGSATATATATPNPQ